MTQPARVLDVDPDAYHALPLFSASTAKTLVMRSALHAIDAWERKIENDAAAEDIDEDQRKRMERGTVLHHMLLGKGRRIAVIPADVLGKGGAYSTKESRAARDHARSNGMVPVKEADHDTLSMVANAIRSRLAHAGYDLDGISEFAVEWSEPSAHGEVRCKAMMDHVITWGIAEQAGNDPGAIIYDLKIVDDANPDKCERTAASLAYQIQAAAYTRALAALHPRLAGRIEFRFLFCEARRPYDFWDPTPDGMFRELGEQQWLRAVRAWADGHAAGRWPGYRTEARKEITSPVWALRQEGFATNE